MKHFSLFKLTLLFCFSFILKAESQNILGEWQTLDPETQKIESTINIFLKEGKLYAKIIGISNPKDRDKLCIECKGKNHNKPILGLTIITGLTKDGDEWNGGKILDPKSGKTYKCYITLKDDNTLKIRGYIGFSLLGRTELWYRNY
jgi:uncharacterized protein (DUF2147 family)